MKENGCRIKNLTDEILLSGDCTAYSGEIEEECDLMDYEGSRLYDEYPDKYIQYNAHR